MAPPIKGRVRVTDAFGDIPAGTQFQIRVLVPGGRADECGGYAMDIRSRDMPSARREVTDLCKRFLDEFFPPPAPPPS